MGSIANPSRPQHPASDLRGPVCLLQAHLPSGLPHRRGGCRQCCDLAHGCLLLLLPLFPLLLSLLPLLFPLFPLLSLLLHFVAQGPPHRQTLRAANQRRNNQRKVCPMGKVLALGPMARNGPRTGQGRHWCGRQESLAPAGQGGSCWWESMGNQSWRPQSTQATHAGPKPSATSKGGQDLNPLRPQARVPSESAQLRVAACPAAFTPGALGCAGNRWPLVRTSGPLPGSAGFMWRVRAGPGAACACAVGGSHSGRCYRQLCAQGSCQGRG